MTTHSLNYLIDPTFTKVNLKMEICQKNKSWWISFSKYYISTVEIKNFNVLIGAKRLFDAPIKNKEEEIMKKLLKWAKIMITQLVIYWIMNIFKVLQINCNRLQSNKLN